MLLISKAVHQNLQKLECFWTFYAAARIWLHKIIATANGIPASMHQGARQTTLTQRDPGNSTAQQRQPQQLKPGGTHACRSRQGEEDNSSSERQRGGRADVLMQVKITGRLLMQVKITGRLQKKVRSTQRPEAMQKRPGQQTNLRASSISPLSKG